MTEEVYGHCGAKSNKVHKAIKTHFNVVTTETNSTYQELQNTLNFGIPSWFWVL